MSRTNHYRICEDCTTEAKCDFHSSLWWQYIHKPERFIDARRPWTRKGKYKHGPRRFHNSPPRWWWHEEHASYRRLCSELIRKYEDPVLPRVQDVINLYGWW